MCRALLRRAMVFLDGVPLKQVFLAENLAAQDGAFWVRVPACASIFRLPDDRSAWRALLRRYRSVNLYTEQAVVTLPDVYDKLVNTPWTLFDGQKTSSSCYKKFISAQQE